MPVTVHAAPWVLPVAGRPLADGAVEVRAGRVTAVGHRRELLATADRVHDWPGVLVPGLVNAHAHLEYGPSFADLADGRRAFPAWIAEVTRRRRTADPDRWAADAAASAALLLAGGTTCVADVVSAGPGAAAAAAAGLAGVSYLESVGVAGPGWPGERRRLAAALAAAPAGRRLGLAPHSVYSLDAAAFTGCLRLARRRGVRVHTHLAESSDESRFVSAGDGRLAELVRSFGGAGDVLAGRLSRTPTARLRTLGGLRSDCHVAHGVHVDTADRAQLRSAGVAVALCPRSNRTLRVGEPPVAGYRADRVLVAVGTDSMASADSLDLRADLALLRRLAVRQGSPERGLDRWLVRAATAGGAAAMGLTDVGRLAPGARADLAVFEPGDDEDPHRAVTDPAGRCLGSVLAGRLVHDRVGSHRRRVR